MDGNKLYVPSVWRVLHTDYWSFLLLFSVIVTGFFVPAQPFLVLPLLVLLTVFNLLRVRLIRRTFETGSSTEARVVGRSFSRGLWTATYEFEVEDRTVKANDDYLSFRMPIEIGDRYPVVFDPQRPERAFLKPFFLPPNQRDLS